MKEIILSVFVIVGLMFGAGLPAHSCIRVHEGQVPSIEHLKNADIIFWGQPGYPKVVSSNGEEREIVTSFKVLKRQRGLLLGRVKIHWTFTGASDCERVFYPGHNYYVLAYKKNGKYWTDDHLNYLVHVPSKEQLERQCKFEKKMQERRKK